MVRWFAPGAALVVGLAGCTCSPDSPASPDFGVEVCRPPPDGHRCDAQDCGGNSPIVNEFPINGLAIDGQGTCNLSGVQLLPRSLQGGACGSGADLSLDGTGARLIGTREGRVLCTGEELTGATFTVRSHTHATLLFTVAGVRRIRVQGADGGSIEHEGYRIEAGGDSACEPEVAARVRRQLGLIGEARDRESPPPLVVHGYEFGPDDDLVIAVGEPLYDLRDQLLRGLPGRWFNLACAGDALAKQRLHGLHEPGNDDANLTSLRMITANYCGKAYTARGMEISWLRSDTHSSVHEADWFGGKAICIENPRLMGSQGFPVSQLPDDLQPADCRDQVCDEGAWTKALLAECNLPLCTDITESRQVSFSSFVGGNSVLVHDASR